MPVFSQQAIETKKPQKQAIPQELIDQYKAFIDQLEKGNEGTLEFTEGEDINKARKALVEAGVQAKKYVKVRKLRGQTNVLIFRQISKKEFDDAKKKAAERGKKLRGKRKSD